MVCQACGSVNPGGRAKCERCGAALPENVQPERRGGALVTYGVLAALVLVVLALVRLNEPGEFVPLLVGGSVLALAVFAAGRAGPRRR